MSEIDQMRVVFEATLGSPGANARLPDGRYKFAYAEEEWAKHVAKFGGAREEIIALAKEAGFRIGQMDTLEGSRTLVKPSGFDCLAELTRFAELLSTHNAAPAPTGFSKFELVHMASQAGMIPVSYNKTSFDTEQSAYTPDLERFAALVAAKAAAAEREACAQVCDEIQRTKAHKFYGQLLSDGSARQAAAAIRARSAA